MRRLRASFVSFRERKPRQASQVYSDFFPEVIPPSGGDRSPGVARNGKNACNPATRTDVGKLATYRFHPKSSAASAPA